MRAAPLAAAWTAVMLCATGCERAATCSVTQYGPRHMTYSGSAGEFGNACRDVLHDLGYREDLGDNRVGYPHHAESVSSYKDGERKIAVEATMKTRDEDGAEYAITTLQLGDRDAVVMLTCTASDPYRLVNALNTEFANRGFEVTQY